MVSDTQSARKIKDEVDVCSLVKKLINGKDSSKCSPGKAAISGVRRSTGEASLSRQTNPSPQSMWRSNHLEIGTALSTPSLKRKYERLEKHNLPSSLRRSDKHKGNLSSSSSGSRQYAKEFSLSESRMKKELNENKKNLAQLTMESELHLESVGMKRKRMTGRTFKSLFKSQCIKEIEPGVDGELEGSEDKQSHACSDNNIGIVLPMGQTLDVSDECIRRVVGKLRDKSVDRYSNGALQNLTGISRGYNTNIFDKDTNVNHNVMDNIMDEPPDVDGLEDLQTSSGAGEIFDDYERLPTKYSPIKKKDTPESESSTCLRRLRDNAMKLESGDKCTHRKDATLLSAKCESSSLMGICVLCSREKRIRYNSQEKELCSCDATSKKDLHSLNTCKDRSDQGAAVTWESSEKCDHRNSLKETHLDCQKEDHENVCAVCNKDGELLRCEGKDCKRCYHLCCLDPPLFDFLPGIWHCQQCVNKKLEFGVYSVSEGVESIWDVREVEVPNAKGNRQRQYLIKYHGLAHVHNHWVSEIQLLLENHSLVSNFVPKDKIARWSAECTVPHRLLRKRPILNKFRIASSTDISESNYEWLVKWRSLDYDYATWELDGSDFLSSSLGQNLKKEYEVRREKAKKAVDKCHKRSFVELLEDPASGLSVNDNSLLKNLNKLCECWYKCQNAVILDNQEQARTVVFFIQSMTEICQPFLIVAASDSLSRWEAEFAQLVPSVDVVVYNGNRDTRKGIRASEFYEEGGCVMLQVLLSSREAVFEDLDMLRCIRWQSIVIDEYQHSGIPTDLEQIKILTTNSRILLISGQIKDTTSEYLNLLSLLDSHGDFNKLRGLKSETNENLVKLKERLSCFIAYGSTSGVSKFLEYWVPVQISNHQLEQYCATLLSNSVLLSCSRNDEVGALRDILLTVRKCCAHPYVVDSFVQERMLDEGRPAAELLNVGIKASGKLQLLDMMLTQLKTRGLQVLVLFQSIHGLRRPSTGDILDDFLFQRFGQNAYECVVAGLSRSKKEAAVNRFNKKETGQFVFLLENRACCSTIKLLSLDVIILYDSDWNPANDLRALQKISIDLATDQIKVFRLYSSCTVEERALVLATKNLNLDNNLKTLSRATSDSLLMWGATHLFSKLDDYHAESSSDLNIISGQLVLDKVINEFQSILSESCERNDINPVISKVKLDVGSYSTNAAMLGEAKVKLKDGEEPHVFWRNLLDRKSPQWKHLRGQGPRNRKRVQYMDGSCGKSYNSSDDVVKNSRRAVIENVDPASVQVELEDQVTQVAGSKGGPSKTISSNLTQSSARESVTSNHDPNYMPSQSYFRNEVGTCGSEERNASSGEQKSLHTALQEEMGRLCQEEPSHCSEERDCLLAEEAISKGTFTVNEEVSPCSSFKLKNLKMNIEEISACEEHYEGQILLHQKPVLKNKGTDSEIDSMIKQIQEKCDKRVKKLIRKQQAEIQEFHQICEEKRLKLETDYNLESAIIRFIYGEGSARMDKLHLLDCNFAKKMADNNLLKGMLLKDLEVKQLASKNEERQKAANWLAEAKACSSGELRALCRTPSLGLQSEEDADCSQSSTHILGAGDVVPIRREHLEDKNPSKTVCMQESDVAPSDTAVSAPAEEVGCSAPIGTPSNLVCIDPPNEVGVTFSERLSLAVVEQLNQSKHFSTGEITSGTLPASGERVSDEMRLVELNKKVPLELPETVPDNIVDHVNLVELSNASDKGYDRGEIIGLPDALMNQRDVIEKVTSGGLPLIGKVLKPSDKTKASQDRCGLSPLQVPENLIHQNLESAELQDQGAPALEEQNTFLFEVAPEVESQTTSQIEVATSELIGTVAPVHSSIELQDQDASVVDDHGTLQIEVVNSKLVGTVTPLEFNVEVHSIENCEKLHLVSIDVSPSCNQYPAIEVECQSHDLGKNSYQTAEAVETEVLTHESVSQIGENLEIQINNPGSVSGVASGTSIELSASSPNNVVMSEAVMSAIELPNQDLLQLEMDVGHLYGYSFLFPEPNDQIASWNCLSLVVEPLENELEKICKEVEQLEKSHEAMMSCMKSDGEKEIQEIIAQIRNEYEVKLQDAEAEFRLRKNGLDKNQNKVLMNKMLAEAFSSRCLDVMSSGLTGMQQGTPSCSMQHLHQLSLQHSVRLPPESSVCRPAPSQQIGSPTIPPMQQLSPPRSIRFCPVACPTIQATHQLPQPHTTRVCPVPSQNFADPPVQTVQYAAAVSSRPPVIRAITHGGNLHFGGEIHSRAPSVQYFRPAAALSLPPASISQCPPQQLLSSQPLQQPPPAPRLPQVGQPALHNPSLSALELLENRPCVPWFPISSPLPEIYSIFGSLEPSYLETPSNGR